MTKELLDLCNYPVNDSKKALHMGQHFPALKRLAPSQLIIPLQESLIASLPPSLELQSTHKPFPANAPTFASKLSQTQYLIRIIDRSTEFHDEIDIMSSLARPRKITILGSDGQTYMFLGKPKDDLRKDARLMDFNAIINKLLKSNSDSRKRQLR